MPIKVVCKCGQKFNAKDSLAGKTVKCPKCGQPLKIQAASTSGPAAEKAAPTPSTPAPSTPPTPDAGLGDLLDEVGFQHVAGGRACPKCNASMPPGGTICVKCGLNLQTGEHFNTVIEHEKLKVRGTEEAVELKKHGNFMLDQAEREIHFNKKEAAKTDDNMPWWVYLIGLLFLLGAFTVVGTQAGSLEKEDINATTEPEGNLLLGFGLLFVSTGYLLSFAAWIISVIAGFKEKPVHGILNLLSFGIYSFFYTAMRYTRLSLPFKTYVAGSAMMIVGNAFAVEAGSPSFHFFRFLLFIAAAGCIFPITIGFAKITTFAYEEEENILHAVFCCVTYVLCLNIYTIIFGFMRWEKLSGAVLQTLIGAIFYFGFFITAIILMVLQVAQQAAG